jgi:hypothetical protein
MGQQQLILIILGTIIVGIALAVGISMFGANNVIANKEAMVEDLTVIGADARAYFMKSTFIGGGGRSYVGYRIPGRIRTTDNGEYHIVSVSSAGIEFQGISGSDPNNTMNAKLDATHDHIIGWTFSQSFIDAGE